MPEVNYFATEDFSALHYLRDPVEGTDYYDEIDLLTEPKDPRNLFGLLNLPAPQPHPVPEAC